MTTPRPLLLFDIDGTLLRTSAGGQAMRTVAARLFGDSFTFDGIHFGGKLDPAIFAEAAALNRLDDHEAHHDSFRAAYLAELELALAQSAEQIRVMPGILNLLDRLRPRSGPDGELLLGLLTGNYSLAAPLKLVAAGIDPGWFTLTAFGDEGKTRPDLVALAMRKYEVHTGTPPDPARVIVIGDTPRDVACAKAHGCTAFAVATGVHPLDELVNAGADVAVPDLADPAPLLQLIGG